MQLIKLNRALVGALLISGGMGVVSQAHALTLVPFTTFDSVTTWGVTSTSNLGQAAMETLTGVSPLGLAYKQDFGGSESGSGTNYYTTSFSADPTPKNNDMSGATITWGGSMKISCDINCFLVVKDGNHSQTPPPWPQYVFDISGWNGTDTINLSGFWPGPGAISNVAIWNGSGTITPVPEPETYAMLLAGLGLVGFAARRKLSR